jgi:hypothetical protein
MERQGRGGWIFGPFFNWFSPRFSATTFALRRNDEYEADRAAASVAGKENVARSLLRLPYLDDHLDRTFWQPLYQQSRQFAELPRNAFQGMSKPLSPEDLPEMKKHLERALAAKTDYQDTHPSLSDRLSSLEVQPVDLDRLAEDLARPAEPNAAEALLGDALPRIVENMEARFAERVGPTWREAHKEFAQSSVRWNELEAVAEKSKEEAVEHAVLAYRILPTSEALPILREAFHHFPEEGGLAFVLGEALLESLDPETPSMFELAVRLDPDLQDAARERLASYHFQTGSEETARKLREEAYDEGVRDDLDRRTAINITLKNELLPPDLDSKTIEALRRSLSEVDRLQTAFLVRRLLPSNRHCYYLVVYHRQKTLESETEPQKLVERVSDKVELPPRTLILSLPPRKKWMQKLSGIPGAQVFESA